jgi:hypothetical protein
MTDVRFLRASCGVGEVPRGNSIVPNYGVVCRRNMVWTCYDGSVWICIVIDVKVEIGLNGIQGLG